jgi:acyl-CoA thioester hydrolase
VGAVNRSTYRVIYGDTDQMGVVYYANYLVFFERGRCELMRERGFDYAAFEREGYAFPVVDASCKYLAPARFDDLLTIETKPRSMGGATLTLDQRVLRGEEVLITAQVRIACVANGRPARIPKGVREALGG